MPEVPQLDNEDNRAFTNHIIQVIEMSGLETAKQVYGAKKKSQELLEFLMRQEAFDHIDNGKPEIAMQIFEMNVFVYPGSAKALQGLGEGYMETGNKELALEYFKESLRINPENPFVKEMMEKLAE
jgi:tetratricopeptide (TPR) repeat protein